MAKMQKIKMMKKKTRIKPGIEFRSDDICFLILGILFTDLKGLRIRKVLKAFRPELLPPMGRNPTMLMQTMKKSRQFHASNR